MKLYSNKLRHPVPKINPTIELTHPSQETTFLKGTGRTEKLKEIEVDVFEYFFHFKLFGFPFAKFF